MPNLGNPIPVACQLYDGSIYKFVQAHLRDASGADLPGSPVAVPHAAGGLYINNTFLMPPVAHVFVTFRVFDDALFTKVSRRHTDAIDIVELTENSGGFATLIPSADLKGVVEVGETLEGRWDEGEIAEGNIPSDTVLSGVVIDDSPVLAGFIEADDLEGSLDDNSELEGEI